LLFTWNPLDQKVDIVLLQVDVVERLLGVESAHDVLEGDQGILFLTENFHILKFPKHAEYYFDVVLA